MHNREDLPRRKICNIPCRSLSVQYIHLSEDSSSHESTDIHNWHKREHRGHKQWKTARRLGGTRLERLKDVALMDGGFYWPVCHCTCGNNPLHFSSIMGKQRAISPITLSLLRHSGGIGPVESEMSAVRRSSNSSTSCPETSRVHISICLHSSNPNYVLLPINNNTICRLVTTQLQDKIWLACVLSPFLIQS